MEEPVSSVEDVLELIRIGNSCR